MVEISILQPNGYFDPVTHKTTDFGDGKYIECIPQDLSNPIVTINKTKEIPAEKTSKEPKKSVSSQPKQSVKENPPALRSQSGEKRIVEKFIDGVHNVGHEAIEMVKSNPMIAVNVAQLVFLVARGAKNFHSFISSGSKTTGNKTNIPLKPVDETPSTPKPNVNAPVAFSQVDVKKNYPSTSASPKQHIVKASGQTYHTKDGIKFIHKASYTRGGKK